MYQGAIGLYVSFLIPMISPCLFLIRHKKTHQTVRHLPMFSTRISCMEEIFAAAANGARRVVS